MSGESPTHVTSAGQLWLPSANVVGAYWIRHDNRTFLNKGAGPMKNMIADLDALVKTGYTQWEKMMGTNQSTWVFNTECCATDTYFQMAVCRPAATAAAL